MWGLFSAAASLRALTLAAALLLPALSQRAEAQVYSSEAGLIQNAIGARIDALTILGGDFGLSDGEFHSTDEVRRPGPRADVDTSIAKFGGGGDVGDPEPLGRLNIGWQPQLQGSLGYLESSYHLRGPPLAGDTSELRTFAIEFGGGARFWLTQRFSLAPTVMVLYGHTSDSFSARSAFARENLAALRQLGLIDWSVDTGSLRPALDVQYIITVHRALLTFSTDAAAFLTEAFARSNQRLSVGGDSGFVTNKIDLDIPLGIQLFGHELRTGGYLSRTDLLGNLEKGLAVEHLNELHGRLVLDFLDQLRGVQWLGLGASYLWGPNISGWTIGADVALHF